MTRAISLVASLLVTGLLAVPANAQDHRSPDTRDAAARAQPQVLVRGEQWGRDRLSGARSTEVGLRGDTWARDHLRPVESRPAVVVRVADASFDWADASAGAAAMLGLVSILGGAALAHGRWGGRYVQSR